MWQVHRSLTLVLFAVASMTLLALMSTISVPVSKADDPDDALNALMMGGTGQQTPQQSWMDSIIDNYFTPATGNSYIGVAVTTPEGLSIDHSIQVGLADLQAAMAQQEANYPGDPFLVSAYSQSTAILTEEKEALAAIPADQRPDVTLAYLGSGTRPDGGVFERLEGLYIPGFEINFSGAEPTDVGIPTIDICGQFDITCDLPQYPANLVADLNALLGLIYVHADYGGLLSTLLPGATWTPLEGPFADQYVEGSSEIVQQVSGDTTFYFIPTEDLPLLDPLRTLGVPESVLNIVQPALRVIVEAGYDRSIPFGDPTPAELIPTVDPVTFTLEFTQAVVQGADNAFELFGAQLPGYDQLQGLLNDALAWSTQEIGAPYYDVVSALNQDFNPFTLAFDAERPIGEAIEAVLTGTGIQQLLLDPVLDNILPDLEGLLGVSF